MAGSAASGVTDVGEAASGAGAARPDPAATEPSESARPVFWADGRCASCGRRPDRDVVWGERLKNIALTAKIRKLERQVKKLHVANLRHARAKRYFKQQERRPGCPGPQSKCVFLQLAPATLPLSRLANCAAAASA